MKPYHPEPELLLRREEIRPPTNLKKAIIPNPAKSFGYIKCCSSNTLGLLKSLAVPPGTTVRRSAVDREDLN